MKNKEIERSTDSQNKPQLRTALLLSTTTGAEANGSSSNVVTATLTNNDTLVNGETVTFFIDSGEGSFPDGGHVFASKTNIIGECTALVTSTKEGKVTVLATCYVDNQTLTQSVTMEFVKDTDEGSGEVLTGSIIKNNAPADNVTANQILFTLCDKLDRPIENKVLLFSSPNSELHFEKILITNTEGEAILNCTSLLSEQTMMVYGKLYEHDDVTDTVSDIVFSVAEHFTRLKGTVLANGATANGIDANIVEYQLEDERHSRFEAQDIYIHISDSSAKPSAEILKTNSEGKALLTISDTVAEECVITATTKWPDVLTTNKVNFISESAIIKFNYGINSCYPSAHFNIVKGRKYKIEFHNEGLVYDLISCQGYFDPDAHNCVSGDPRPAFDRKIYESGVFTALYTGELSNSRDKDSIYFSDEYVGEAYLIITEVNDDFMS